MTFFGFYFLLEPEYKSRLCEAIALYLLKTEKRCSRMKTAVFEIVEPISE